MRTTGSFGTPRFLAVPLLCSVVALSLNNAGCSSATPSTDGSSGASASGAGASNATAGAPTSGGSTSVAGSSSAGAPAQGGSGGDTPSSGGAGASAGGAGAGGSSAGASTGGAGGASAGSGGTAGGVAAGNGCDGVTAKFCEDFEKQTSGQAPTGIFKVSANAGAMVVDATKPHGGKQSLHIKMAKPGARAMLDFSFMKATEPTDLFGRAMMYITAIPTNDTHWDLAYAYSDATPSEEWELGGQNGIFALVIDPPDHEVNSKNNPIPTGKWFCLQWEFKYGGAGADNTYSAKVNGVALDKGEWTGADPSGMKWPAGPWKNLSVGWETYGGSNVDVENWIDDLAYGDQPIPCPAP